MVVQNISQRNDCYLMKDNSIKNKNNRLLLNDFTFDNKLIKIKTLHTDRLQKNKLGVISSLQKVCLFAIALTSNVVRAYGMYEPPFIWVPNLIAVKNELYSNDIMCNVSESVNSNHCLKESMCVSLPVDKSNFLDPYDYQNPKHNISKIKLVDIEESVFLALKKNNFLNFSDNDLSIQKVIIAMLQVYHSNCFKLQLDVGKSILQSTSICNESKFCPLDKKGAQSEIRNWMLEKIFGKSPEVFLAERVVKERMTFMYTFERLKNLVSKISIDKESIIHWHAFCPNDQIKLINLWQIFLQEELAILYNNEFYLRLKNFNVDDTHSFYYLLGARKLNEMEKNLSNFNIDDILNYGFDVLNDYSYYKTTKYDLRFYSMIAVLYHAINDPEQLKVSFTCNYEFKKDIISAFFLSILKKCGFNNFPSKILDDYSAAFDIAKNRTYTSVGKYNFDIAYDLATMAAKLDRTMKNISIKIIGDSERQFIFSEQAIILSSKIVPLVKRNGKISFYYSSEHGNLYNEISRLDSFCVFVNGESRNYLWKRNLGRGYDLVRFDRDIPLVNGVRDDMPFLAVMVPERESKKDLLKKKSNKENEIEQLLIEKHSNVFKTSLIYFLDNYKLNWIYSQNLYNLPFGDLIYDEKNFELMCYIAFGNSIRYANFNP